VSAKVAAGTSLTNDVLTMLTGIQGNGGTGTTPFLDWATPTLSNQLPTYLQGLAAGQMSSSAFTAQVQSDWSTFQQQRKSG
jgi:hypothetical protein